MPKYWTPGFLLGAWVLIPYALIYIKSQLSNPMTHPRYFIILVPPLYLLLARALCRLPLAARLQTALLSLLALGGLGYLVYGMNFYTQPGKEQWREAVAYVVRHEREKSAPRILFYAEGTRTDGNLFEYFFRQEQAAFIPRHDPGAERGGDSAGKDASAEERRFVQEYVSGAPRFWYVWAHKTPHPEFFEFLDARYKLLDRLDLKKAGVRLYENPAGRAVERP